MAFALWERILLLVLVAGTGAWFAKDLRPKVRHILAGSADRHRSDELGQRLWRVVKEVVFQSRVVGGRPIVGLMHAVVFFGFVAFGLETVDHFLEPFDIPFLSVLLGPAHPVFKAFLAVMAAGVIVAITGLAFRRFVLIRISPDPTSWSSGLVAAMIVVLMITYLYGIAPSPSWEKANWWLHAAVIVVFPPLILRSKHFHILMAPVAIFFRTHRLGELLPLTLDPDALEASAAPASFGLETMADAPWKMRMDFLTCVECKRCTEQCPAWACGQELNPRGFILAGRERLGQDVPVIGGVISETALGQCTSCGACENACPVGIEHLQVLIGAKRAQALASGKGMVATEFLQTVERYGNPFREPLVARQRLIAELAIPAYRPGVTEYLLWLGCVWNYNADARRGLASLVEILTRAGVSYGVLESESCTGHHSRRQGEELQFQTLAGENIERFRGAAVTRVIAPCPHCLHTFRREYPTLEQGFELEVIHHSEMIARLLAEGRIPLQRSTGEERRVTFHDPCYLGRYERVFEAPRKVIAATGLPLVELPRRRERSFCCGGGNAGFVNQREEEQRVDQERKREIQASGADILVTACPECKMMLGAATAETKDLAELVAERMPPASEASGAG